MGLFYCERQPCGSSLSIKTSIFIRQQRSPFVEDIVHPDGVKVRIRKREGGIGSCASIIDSVRVVDPVSLVYQLLDVNGRLVSPLGEGSFYGGITIATPNVTMDTLMVTGLPPGTYRIVPFESTGEWARVEFVFRVPFRSLGRIRPIPWQLSRERN